MKPPESLMGLFSRNTATFAGIIFGAMVLSSCQTGGISPPGPVSVADPVSVAGPVSVANAAGNAKVLRHDAEAARLINAYRSSRGVGPVRVDATLTKTAAAHALDLARSGLTGHIRTVRTRPPAPAATATSFSPSAKTPRPGAHRLPMSLPPGSKAPVTSPIWSSARRWISGLPISWRRAPDIAITGF